MSIITVAEYIADKRGAIPAEEPRALNKLGLSAVHWTRKVLGVGFGFWRVVGTVDDIREKVIEMKQRFLPGLGFARALSFL